MKNNKKITKKKLVFELPDFDRDPHGTIEAVRYIVSIFVGAFSIVALLFLFAGIGLWELDLLFGSLRTLGLASVFLLINLKYKNV